MNISTLEQVRKDMEHGVYDMTENRKCNANGNFKDLSGLEINGIKVVSYAEIGKNNRSLWNCICHCGNEFVAVGSEIKRGRLKSCGCLLRRINGLYKSRLYRIHHMMMCRCYTESATNYEYYGGKGIKVCKEWHDFMNFYNWAINNGYSEKLTLDRKDGNKDYEPSNCRWATRKEQSNNISSNIIFEFNGRKMTMAEWSRELSINRNTLDKRIRNGWGIEKAFTEPINKNYATRRKS